MDNDFDHWNELKKSINVRRLIDKFPQEGEVWMTNLGKNIGYEQNGVGEEFLGPVLIVKKFNNSMFWIIPLSTKQKRFDFYFNYTDPHNKKVSFILAQLKLGSVMRLKRKMYVIQEDVFLKIKLKLKSFL